MLFSTSRSKLSLQSLNVALISTNVRDGSDGPIRLNVDVECVYASFSFHAV